MVNVFFENKKKSNFSHIIVNYRYNFRPNLMKFGLDLGEEVTNEQQELEDSEKTYVELVRKRTDGGQNTMVVVVI